MFTEPWKDLGIEPRYITRVNHTVPDEYRGREEEAWQEGKVKVDTSDLAWAEVIVVRRYYNTA